MGKGWQRYLARNERIGREDEMRISGLSGPRKVIRLDNYTISPPPRKARDYYMSMPNQRKPLWGAIVLWTTMSASATLSIYIMSKIPLPVAAVAVLVTGAFILGRASKR